MPDNAETRQREIAKLLLERGGQTRTQIQAGLEEKVSAATLLRDLEEMEARGLVKPLGQGKATTYALGGQAKDSPLGSLMSGQTTRVTASSTPIEGEEPLVQVKITNPLAYLKHWWQKIIGNEGIKLKFSLEVKPLTAIAVVAIIATLGFGITTIGAFLKYLPFYQRFQQFVTTPDNSRETAMEGTLYLEEGSGRYFLFTANLNEAVWVQGAKNLDLGKFDNTHVILTGSYNDQTNIFAASTIRSLSEVKHPSAPALAPLPSPSPSPSPLPLISPSPVSTASAKAVPSP